MSDAISIDQAGLFEAKDFKFLSVYQGIDVAVSRFNKNAVDHRIGWPGRPKCEQDWGQQKSGLARE